jgi:hypothetical protein
MAGLGFGRGTLPATTYDMIVRCMLFVLVAATAVAAPIRVRYPEGPARGLLVLTNTDDKPLAHGELEQWMEGPIVASRLTFEFADGSIYDEVVRFSQRRVFRLESYKLRQHGPSFTETADVEFDRRGGYRVRRRETPDAEEERAEGRTELPDDILHGLTSVVCKNVMPDGAATVHFVAFQPKPLVMEMRIGAEGVDRFLVGPLERSASRFLVQPHVTGLKGAFATVVGKQPPDLSMWIARGRAPLLVRFEGPLYADGPTWRVEPTGPRWDR